eukprot:TRINITY_DN52579_c0_g1_i1.p2 TRINITY_DN52579_c0_g1~~TRINITY_DN52579_c0_g1_i1.p2  ORF type:complete len:185 (+),score=46.52 TRINITY_DN52579_c0_g1_i1:22-555(+)
MEDITSRLPEAVRTDQFCKYCRIVRPPRAKHCHKCGCCIAKFDHHCFWLKNCVGSMNHREFVVFLVLINVWFVWGCAHMWHLLTPGYPALYPGWYVFLAGAGMECFALPLLVGHLFFMATNTTTVEFARPEKFFYLRGGSRNPFGHSFARNMRRFWFVASRLPPEDFQPVTLPSAHV